VRPVAVMDNLPAAEFSVDLFERVRQLGPAVELFLVGALRAFHMPVQLGRTWRKDEEVDAAILASGLELGHELGATVDLDRPDGKGHTGDERMKEAGRGVSRGAAMCLQDLPAAGDVAGSEVFESEAGVEDDVSGIDLNDVTWGFGQVVLGLTDTVRTLERSPLDPWIATGSFDQTPALLELEEDATDHRSGSRASPGD
jgi:hypothetical protein